MNGHSFSEWLKSSYIYISWEFGKWASLLLAIKDWSIRNGILISNLEDQKILDFAKPGSYLGNFYHPEKYFIVSRPSNASFQIESDDTLPEDWRIIRRDLLAQVFENVVSRTFSG